MSARKYTDVAEVCPDDSVGPGCYHSGADLGLRWPDNDHDGGVVVAHAQVAQVLDASRQREQRQAEMMRRLAAGELTLDLLGFRQALDRHGLAIRE